MQIPKDFVQSFPLRSYMCVPRNENALAVHLPNTLDSPISDVNNSKMSTELGSFHC